MTQRTFWRQPYKDFYSPVTYTTWTWLANLSRASAAETAALRPEIFHTANILLHASNTVLVFFLVFGLTRKLVGALLGAVVFAIHPMQVESVAWISEYRGLLAVFFSLTALMLYWQCRFAETARARWWWVAVASVSFVLALLSKPSVVALPMVIAG